MSDQPSQGQASPDQATPGQATPGQAGDQQVDLPAELLEILVCPNCHASLAVDHDRGELVCTGIECGLAYPVRDQIPVLLVDAARSTRNEPPTSEPAAGDPA